MSGRSSCPECGTILRIRDRTFVGRRVSCPECKTTLRIESEDDRGGFVTRQLTAGELAAIEQSHRAANAAKGSPNKVLLSPPPARSFIGRLIDSPLTAAWMLAIAVSSLIAVLALAPKSRFTAARPVPATIGPDSSIEQSQETPPEQRDSGAPPIDTAIPLTSHSVDGDSEIVSALQPANVDGPLRWPPDPVLVEIESEPPALTPSPPVKIDVEAKMTQKLVSYKQTKPVSRRELIEALQEYLGAPIHYDHDELGAANLDKTVTFELENTTVGEVIKVISDAAGWEINVEATGLRLSRKLSP